MQLGTRIIIPHCLQTKEVSPSKGLLNSNISNVRSIPRSGVINSSTCFRASLLPHSAHSTSNFVEDSDPLLWPGNPFRPTGLQQPQVPILRLIFCQKGQQRQRSNSETHQKNSDSRGTIGHQMKFRIQNSDARH